MRCRCPIATVWCRASILTPPNPVLRWAICSTLSCVGVMPRRWRIEVDNQSKELFGQTPWQTVGPFFHYGLPWKGGADLVGQSDMGARPDLFPQEHYVLNLSPPRGKVAGQVIEISGRVLD